MYLRVKLNQTCFSSHFYSLSLSPLCASVRRWSSRDSTAFAHTTVLNCEQWTVNCTALQLHWRKNTHVRARAGSSNDPACEEKRERTRRIKKISRKKGKSDAELFIAHKIFTVRNVVHLILERKGEKKKKETGPRNIIDIIISHPPANSSTYSLFFFFSSSSSLLLCYSPVVWWSATSLTHSLASHLMKAM